MRSVLITGANKGIGLATAKALSQKGLFVYLGSRDKAKGAEAVTALAKQGFHNISPIELDVTVPPTIWAAREIIAREQGHLDILINNAGISGALPQSATDTGTDEYRAVFAVNFYGVINVTQAFLELLRKAAEPRIVNVSTSVGSLSLQSDPAWPAYAYAKYPVYAASKAALNMYTVQLAYELRNTALKVNAVCPGYTSTDFTNNNGGSVEDAAQRLVKYALIGKEGPTGKFISEETNPATHEIPW